MVKSSLTKPDLNKVKPLLSGHLQDLPKCPLIINKGCSPNRGCKNCTMFVSDQHSMVTLLTVIKLHIVKEAIQSSSSLPFITNFNLFVNAKTLTDLIQYVFQGHNPILLLPI